jgi:hypothetical protein
MTDRLGELAGVHTGLACKEHADAAEQACTFASHVRAAADCSSPCLHFDTNRRLVMRHPTSVRRNSSW